MYTEICCIVDKSGSMQLVRDDSIGGFNSFLQSQKEFPGKAKFTLITFNQDYDVVYDGVDIQEVSPLTFTNYLPSGGTAMYDAIGRAIDTIGARLNKLKEKDRPSKVIVSILTDGQENSSKEYSKDKIAEMIKHQESKYSWEFIFLAANQDAFATGAGLNIKSANTMGYASTGIGTRKAFTNISNMTTSYRSK